MSSSRLSGYRRSTDEHPGAENYPAEVTSPADSRATENFRMPRPTPPRGSYPAEYTPDYKSNLDGDLDASYGGYHQHDSAQHDSDPADYDEWDDYEEPDHRWRWAVAAAAAVLLVTVLIITMAGSGDDTPAAETSDTPTAPRTVIATEPSATAPAPAPVAPTPSASLPPETVTTVTSPPAEPFPAPAPAEEAAPPAVPAPGTITYTVTGSRQLFDLVSIIYTDEQGLPRTDVNVALPWSRTVVLNPGVTTMSVTATSLSGQLNCTITDAMGNPIVAQANNLMISSCSG
ncbi:MAG: MmpS family transport accessory protein [Mycobacterium sp.]